MVMDLGKEDILSEIQLEISSLLVDSGCIRINPSQYNDSKKIDKPNYGAKMSPNHSKFQLLLYCRR